MIGSGLCIQASWHVPIGPGAIIGYRSENSKGFLMQNTNSAKKRWFLFITGFILIILMGLVIRVSYHNTPIE